VIETLDYVTMAVSVALGMAGGIAHVFIDAKSWEDVKKFSSVRQIVIGAIVGGVYSFLHSDYGFPNFVMTFVSGYAGIDFIQGLAEKLKNKLHSNSN